MLSVLIGLVVLGGVTSQSLMDIATVLILLVFLYEFARKRTSFRDLRTTGIEWAIIGYFLVAVIGLALNGKAPVPWFSYLSKFNWVLNLYLLVWAFDRVPTHPPLYAKWLASFCIVFAIPDIYAVLTYVMKYDYLTKHETLAVIGFVNSATYHAHGNSLIFVFFASIYVMTFEKLSRSLKLWGAISLVLMGFGIFLTFTRGIWGATFVALLVLSWLRGKKLFGGFLATGLAVIVPALVFSEQVRTRLFNSFTSDSDHLRRELLQVHFRMFKEHPWFGIGYWDSYRQIADYWPLLNLPANHFESHAHNQYVNVLGTTGILGLFFYLAIFVFFASLSWRFYLKTAATPQLRPLAAAILVLLTQFFLACLTDVTFEYAKIRGILIVGLAALLSFSRREIKA